MNISSLWKKDEWWAVWLGFLILGLVTANIIPGLPKISSWTSDLGVALSDIPLFILLCLVLMALTGIAVKCISGKTIIGFPIIFLLAFLAHLISKQSLANTLGLAYAIWALLFGLIIGNTIKVPKWLLNAAQTELFIKTGLVILGAEILFTIILKAGTLGIFEVTIGLSIVWYFCYYLATKVGLTKSLAAIMATATSVCGVSAAIAAGGAVKGDPKEVSYVISLVLLFSGPMIFIMPMLGRLMGLSETVFGAWVGGTIDNTASVVASGALYGEQALQIASVIKLSQNILIGVSAFLLSVYWVLKVEKKTEKPKLIEIWYRFPKFILGFLVASLIFSFILTPAMGATAVSGILKTTKMFRKWFFALSFVSIGLTTKFSDLTKVGMKKGLLVFAAATLVDLILSLITAIIFFGGFV